MSDASGVGKTPKWQPLLLPVDFYGAFMVAYLFLRLISGDHFWVVELFSTVSHWFLLLSFVFLPLAFVRRRWVPLGMLLVSSTAFVYLFGGLFLPGPSSQKACQAPRSVSLRVMTYNISHGLASSAALVDVMERSDAEVIALQELPSGQADIVREELEDLYPHQVFYGKGFSGIALLSQYPILDEESFTLKGPRPYLRAEVDVEGEPLTIFVAHPVVRMGPGSRDAPGSSDMQTLAEMALGGGKTILLGDFNFTDQNQDYRALTRAGLADAHRSAGRGLGLTYPKKGWSGGIRLPLVRIDFVFLTGEICAQRAWVGEDGGSDHLPVLADVAW